MKRGFTLIEILVSVAIFAVVMVIALGALLSVSVSDRKAESLKAVINNLNFAMDSMARAIRTGYNYNCNSSTGGNCTLGGSSLYFTPANGGSQEAYRLDTSGCTNGVGCIERSTDGGATWSAITAPEVIIANPSNRLFYLIGAPEGSNDNVQPKVDIVISGYVQISASQQSAFHLQTSVTQRLYDQ